MTRAMAQYPDGTLNHIQPYINAKFQKTQQMFLTM